MTERLFIAQGHLTPAPTLKFESGPHPWLQQFDQFFGQPFGPFVQAGADMPGFGLQNEPARLIYNAGGEIQADAFRGSGPKLDGEDVVVAGRRLVAQVTFDDGKDDALLLPLQEGGAQVTEKFAARGFQQVEVTGIVDMIADGAIGVGHAMDVFER
jgi:hypothetical protein